MAATLRTPAHAYEANGTHTAGGTHTVPRAAVRAAALALAAIAIQFLMVTAYAWSAASTAPRNVPVAITGPAQQVAAVTGKIELAQPGAFRLVPAGSPGQAAADITSRQAYGAIVLAGAAASPSTPNATTPPDAKPKVLVASGASPAIANILKGLAGHLDGTPAPAVRDLVPSAPADPNGTGFAFTVLPIAMSSLAAGILLSMGIRRRAYHAAALVAFGAGGGLASIAVAHTWLGLLPGSFPVLASATGLAALAAAAGVSGLSRLGALLGRPSAGTAVGGALIMLVGNPFSGAGSAPEMLPGAWGLAGQCLPNGALATLLRSVAYFDGTRSAGPWTVLAVWAIAGLLLTALVRPRAARAAGAADPAGLQRGTGADPAG
ncbi:MAG: hypothetical protein ACRDN0_30995, partial [Trebonia sp.]